MRAVTNALSMLGPILLGIGLSVSSGLAHGSNTDLATSRLISKGEFAQARAVLEQSNPTRADLLFYNARVLKAKGRVDEAIEAFRAVLRLAPDHLNARRELAHTLLLAGQIDVAETQFRDLVDLDPSETMRGGYRRFLAAIDRVQPYGVRVTAELLPSTNINRGTANTVFDTQTGQFIIDESSRKKSGIGARVGFSGFFRKSLSKDSRVVATARLDGTKYRESIYDGVTGTASVSYEHLVDGTLLSAAPFLRHTWRRDDSDNTAVGMAVGAQRRLSNSVSASGVLVHERRRYPDRAFLDGPFTAATASLGYLITPSLVLRGGLTLDRYRPDAAHLRYHGLRGSLAVEKSWTGGLRTDLGGFAGRRYFDADFPLTDDPRGDTLYGIEASAFHTAIEYAGFAPRVSCSYEKQTSTVAFYEYDALGCRMGLTRNF